MTPTEIKELAYKLLGDYGVNVEATPNALMFDRMSSRQRELFAWANTLNPEYFGESVLAAIVDDSYANLNSLENMTDGQPYPIDYLQIVRIYDPGTSEYKAGDRVRIVPADDHRELPPRMTFRSRVLRGVDTDFEGVVSICCWYTRRPHPINSDGTGTVELPEPWHDLLALDLARFLLRRAPDANAAAALEMVGADETRRLETFKNHIMANYAVMEDRFRTAMPAQLPPPV